MAPMRSRAQRGWLWKNRPDIAERWEKHTPKGKKLPYKVAKHSEETPEAYDDGARVLHLPTDERV